MSVHPFPARMAPVVVQNQMKAAPGGSLVVLDPMAGSGTTLLTARLYGHRAIGFDVDPLAVLMSSVSCQEINSQKILRRAAKIQREVEGAWRSIPGNDAYPVGATQQCREYIRYWFDLRNRKQLCVLSDKIRRTRDAGTRDVLWCAFSRLIVTKQAGVSLAMDVSHSRPHRVFDLAPRQPIDWFMNSVLRVLQAAAFVDSSWSTPPPSVELRRGDARCLPIDDCTVDLVVTSPPYLNAIDYMRGHRLSLVWMGFGLQELATVRSGSIGTEAGGTSIDENSRVVRAFDSFGRKCKDVSPRWRRVLMRYVRDMDKMMSEVFRTLVPGGRAVLVIGDSNLRGVFIQNSRALQTLGEQNGLRFDGRSSRPLPENRRYLPPPRSLSAGASLATRMNREVILRFGKPAVAAR